MHIVQLMSQPHIKVFMKDKSKFIVIYFSNSFEGNTQIKLKT